MFQLSVVLLSLLNLVWPSAEPPVPERWHEWPVSRVFPDTVPGSSPSGARVTYVLEGIAPEAPCREALQPAALRALPGCRTALRATYADSTQTYVATVGIAVLDGKGTRTPLARMGGSAAEHLALAGGDAAGITAAGPEGAAWAGSSGGLASTAWAGEPGGSLGALVTSGSGRVPSVRPVAFPDGPAERFGERQYVTGAISFANDRYVVLTAAGYADGRAYRPGVAPPSRLAGVARQLAAELHRVLTR
ncbi:hypothetical protein ACIBHX_39155 [Nonomuraea sp. NPDC050536]|uniref:hypothetical protein n=1 Tax=Nonomuraea sp. NPDC050536 TaxID=3364366 RepID=UPI0037C8E072